MAYRDNAIKSAPAAPGTVTIEVPAAAVANYRAARALLTEARATRAKLFEKQLQAGDRHDRATALLRQHQEMGNSDPVLYQDVGMHWASWQQLKFEVERADALLESAERAYGGASLALQDVVQARIEAD